MSHPIEKIRQADRDRYDLAAAQERIKELEELCAEHYSAAQSAFSRGMDAAAEDDRKALAAEKAAHAETKASRDAWAKDCGEMTDKFLAEKAAHAETKALYESWHKQALHLQAQHEPCEVHHGARRACGQCHDSLAQHLKNERDAHEREKRERTWGRLGVAIKRADAAEAQRDALREQVASLVAEMGKAFEYGHRMESQRDALRVALEARGCTRGIISAITEAGVRSEPYCQYIAKQSAESYPKAPVPAPCWVCAALAAVPAPDAAPRHSPGIVGSPAPLPLSAITGSRKGEKP